MFPIAEKVFELGEDKDIALADLTIATAAPDLLAACEKAAEHHQGQKSEVGKMLRAAIRKARGQTNDTHPTKSENENSEAGGSPKEVRGTE